MLKLKYVFLFCISLISLSGWSQSVFLTELNGQSRVYLHASTGQSQLQRNQSEAYNKPLFIIVHPNKSNPQEIFQSEEIWRAISSEVNLVFPRGWKDAWDCQDSVQLKNDALFLTEVISSSFSNFKIDRNRVYLITLSGSNCIGEVIQKKYPGLISQTVNLPLNQSGSKYVIREIERLLASGKKAETEYSLYQQPHVDIPTSPIDSLKQSSWHQRWVVGIHTGGLYLPGWSRTHSDNTYTDISDSHSFSGIEVTKWMNDSMAWFLDISRLKVPMKQEMGTNTITVGGGMVIPVTIGFKYQLFRHEFYKPYAMLGTGPLQVLVFGDKMRTSSGSTGGTPGLGNNEARLVFHTTLGAGLDMRFGKRIVLGGQFRYIHSSKFEAAGSVNSIRAFTLNFSASYILNANHERSLKSLLK